MDSGSRGLGSRPGRFTVLCSWAQHFPTKVPLFTQEYKWVLANCWGSLMKCWGIILRWIRLLRRKKKNKTICTQLHFESERFWISKAVHETHPDNADFFLFLHSIRVPDDSMPSTVTCISVEYILCLFSSPLFVCPEFVPVLFPADFPPPRNPM